MSRSPSAGSPPAGTPDATPSPTLEAPPPRGGRAVLAAVVVGLVALIGGAVGLWVTQRSDGPSQGGHEASSVDDYPELGFGHVHALGVDPADGVLYAAGHYGVFRVPVTGEPTRVADR